MNLGRHHRLPLLLVGLLTLVGPAAVFGQPQTKEPESPVVERLVRAVSSEGVAAVDRFWEDLKDTGTPLIEDVGLGDRVLATFLWRGEASNVVVVTELNDNDVSRNRMTRLGATDLWFKTYRLPRTATFTYSLSPNDSLEPLWSVQNFAERARTFVADAMNPDLLNFGFYSVSIASMPLAPRPYPSSRAASPLAGRLVERSLSSEVLNEDRRLWFYSSRKTPAEASADPLVVVFDGKTYLEVVDLPRLVDDLVAAGDIPPVTIAFIDNPPSSRSRDLVASDAFAAFVSEEALPVARDELGAGYEASRTILAGSSLGGLAAARLAWLRPDLFGGVIGLSASFHRSPSGEEPEWLLRMIAAAPRRHLAFFLTVGAFETAYRPGGVPSQLATNRHARTLLTSKGYEVTYSEYPGGHDYVYWKVKLAEALRHLLGTS